MYNKIREHIERHKTTYACVVTGIGVAAFTTIIMRERYEGFRKEPYGPKTADTLVTMRPLSFLSSQGNVVKVVNKYGIGRPGYLIHSLDTNEYFTSQREAASVFGISEAILSKHLSGKLENAEGYNFERLRFAS
jgi:hypothetical protein